MALVFCSCSTNTDQSEEPKSLSIDSTLSSQKDELAIVEPAESNEQKEEQQLTLDTLIYEVKSDSAEIEPYDQSLKVVFLSDTTIWFEAKFDHVIGNGKISGVAVNHYPDMDYEIDEFEGLSYPAVEFTMEKNEFYYAIRIHASDSSLARIETTSEVPTDMIPLKIPMKLRTAS